MLTSDAASAVCATYFIQLYTRAFKMFCRYGNHSVFCGPPSPLTEGDAAPYAEMHCIHSGDFSRSPAHKRCYFRCLRYIFRTAVRCILNVLRARQPFRFSRSPAFVIDRGRCRFRVRNALHSRRRLLMLVSDADPAVCTAYFVHLYIVF